MIKVWRSTIISRLEDKRIRQNNSNTRDAGNKRFIEQNITKYSVSRSSIDKRQQKSTTSTGRIKSIKVGYKSMPPQ
jgi:hypothetical protein